MDESRTRVTSEQLDKLLELMEKHPDLANGGSGLYTKIGQTKIWVRIAEELNAYTGGAVKSSKKWMRYWADLKYKARRKCTKTSDLTDLEMRLKNIIGSKPSEDDLSDTEQEAKTELFSEPLMSPGKVSSEELIAEAAMRSALAAERQADAVVEAVSLLRQLVNTLTSQSYNQT